MAKAQIPAEFIDLGNGYWLFNGSAICQQCGALVGHDDFALALHHSWHEKPTGKPKKAANG